jgi:uncharacterized protein YecE (DUF72 family)
LTTLSGLLMQQASALLKQALQLLENTLEADRALAGDRAAQGLIQQAQVAIAHSPQFQMLLAQKVPQPWQNIVQQRLLKQLYRCPHPDRLESWIEEQMARIVKSLKLDQQLCALIQQIQSLPKRSSQRRNLIPVLISQMQASGKITTSIANLPSELYHDALHETLLWFCEHLDEYDPARSGPLVWFNRNLFYTASKIKRSHYRPLPKKFQISEENRYRQGGPDAYDELIAEAEQQILDDLYDWVQRDHAANLKRAALRDRLDINAQAIIKAVLEHIRRLRSLNKTYGQLDNDILADQPTDLYQLFTQLAAQLQCPPAQLQRFWREQCRPQIEAFLQQSGHVTTLRAK